MALAPAYSPFTAAYFRAPRCSCELSRESEVETQSSVRSLIFSPTRKHHQYNARLICLFPLDTATRSSGGNYLRLISLQEIMAARITLLPAINTEHHINGGAAVVFVVNANLVKGKP